jgi:hypothetical protein
MSRREPSAALIGCLAAGAAIFILRVLALLHPGKATVDALFQAHRFEWVLAGRYFFTQPMPSGVAFPYAIGLYVFAAPWAVLTANHVALLRVIVVAVDVGASLVLAAAVARAWREPAAGVLAVVGLALAPLPFVVVGNGNLTNAFGQSVALAALAAIASGFVAGRRWVAPAALAAALTLALVSHVGTLTLLLATVALVVLGFAALVRGVLAREAAVIAGASALAVVLAFGLYYRHFTDVYRAAFTRVLAPSAAAPPAQAAPAAMPADRPAALTRPLSRAERAGDALRQTADAFGWPLLILAAIGVARAWRRGWRDRLTIVVASWAVAWAVFVIGNTLTRVDTQYQRYASEFVGRVDLATLPAVVVLAATALTWLWTPRGRLTWLTRAGALVLGLAAAAVGVQSWLGWFS